MWFLCYRNHGSEYLFCLTRISIERIQELRFRSYTIQPQMVYMFLFTDILCVMFRCSKSFSLFSPSALVCYLTLTLAFHLLVIYLYSLLYSLMQAEQCVCNWFLLVWWYGWQHDWFLFTQSQKMIGMAWVRMRWIDGWLKRVIFCRIDSVLLLLLWMLFSVFFSFLHSCLHFCVNFTHQSTHVSRI